MATEWYRFDRVKPKRNGVYLTLFWVESNQFLPGSGHWFKKGDLLYTKSSTKPTPAERLWDMIFNESLAVRAPHDGFYEISDEHHWEITPDLWAEYPDPPKGVEYPDEDSDA